MSKCTCERFMGLSLPIGPHGVNCELLRVKNDPMSINARLKRGEKCHKCGLVTHRPLHIKPGGGFICRKCG